MFFHFPDCWLTSLHKSLIKAECAFESKKVLWSSKHLQKELIILRNNNELLNVLAAGLTDADHSFVTFWKPFVFFWPQIFFKRRKMTACTVFSSSSRLCAISFSAVSIIISKQKGAIHACTHLKKTLIL